jgi:hypothetical protein
MTNWININGQLKLEVMTPDGDTILLSENQVKENEVYISGFQTYLGKELLFNKPNT